MVIIHFLPIEKYPPVINFLNLLNQQVEKKGITVITTHCDVPIEPFSSKNINIIRIGKINQYSKLRFLQYLLFYIGSLFQLLIKKPKRILWYETLSSFPAIFYYTIRFKKPKLLVHYHEYMSPHEIKSGMLLVRWLHHLEQKIYPKVSWLSHTNEYRMQLFIADNPMVKYETTHLLPNYPPYWWSKNTRKNKTFSFPIKMVYVGSFASFETIYIKEFVDWIKKYPNLFEIDIYSFEIPINIINYCNASNIKIKGPIANNYLPTVLPSYDIGIIMYKAVIDNVKFCASNKLFEYLACGLDVWFPNVMIGSLPYTGVYEHSQVVAIDFDHLKDFDWKKAILREITHHQRSNNFWAENVYTEFIKFIGEK